MAYTKSISLGHKYNIVDIAFGTDNAADFNLGDYQYKLIGYDEAWRPLPGNNIRYMNLPPGRYQLAVQSRPTRLLDGGGASNSTSGSTRRSTPASSPTSSMCC